MKIALIAWKILAVVLLLGPGIADAASDYTVWKNPWDGKTYYSCMTSAGVMGMVEDPARCVPKEERLAIEERKAREQLERERLEKERLEEKQRTARQKLIESTPAPRITPVAPTEPASKPTPPTPIPMRTAERASSAGGAAAIGGIVILTAILVFYFLPALIASTRGVEHGTGIFLVNLFFGWTVLGWIAALIWAVAEKTSPAGIPARPEGPPGDPHDYSETSAGSFMVGSMSQKKERHLNGVPMARLKIHFVLGDCDPDGPGPLEWRGLWFRDENDVALSYDDPRVKRARIEIFKVAGVSHREHNLQDSDFSPGCRLALVPEPNNPYDKNAVGIWNASRGLQIGYVPKELAGEIAGRLRSGEDLQALSLAEWLKDGRRVGLRVVIGPEGVFETEP